MAFTQPRQNNIGNTLFLNDSKIGIGTTTPTEALDIKGNLHIEGNYIFIRSDAGSDGNLGKPQIHFSEDNYVQGDPTSHNNSGNMRIIYDGDGESGDSNFMAIQVRTAAAEFNKTLLHMQHGGNVGIGTTSPMNKLQISHTGGDGDNGLIIVREDINTAADELLGGIGFDSIDGNVPSSILEASAYIAGYASESHNTLNKGGYLTFGTAPDDQDQDVVSSERMRITSNGLVGIGTNDPLVVLHVDGDEISRWVGARYGFLRSNNTTETGSWGSDQEHDLLAIFDGRIAAKKTVFAAADFNQSDERIKTNFNELNDYQCLSQIKQIKPYTYNYIDTIKSGEQNVIGFKAQEINEVINGAIQKIREFIPNIFKNCDIISSNTDSIVINIPNISSYELDTSCKLQIMEYIPDITLEASKQSLNILSIDGVNITMNGFINTTNTTVFIRFIGECSVSIKGDENTNGIIITPKDISSNLEVDNIFEIYESKPKESQKKHEVSITNIDGENVTVDGKFTTTENKVFVYGKEVDDFHYMSYDRITPVLTSALQEIDRRVVSHFTGSHTCYKEDNTLDFTSYIGLIVVSNSNYKITRNGTTTTGKDAIKIDHATPQIKLSNIPNQKSILGVVNRIEDDTVLVNSVGEGGIWVCSKGDDFECGDYITTCDIPGYGVKQADDLHHNYTVAKITCNVNFDDVSAFENKTIIHNSTTYTACFVGCTYHCG